MSETAVHGYEKGKTAAYTGRARRYRQLTGIIIRAYRAQLIQPDRARHHPKVTQK